MGSIGVVLVTVADISPLGAETGVKTSATDGLRFSNLTCERLTGM